MDLPDRVDDHGPGYGETHTCPHHPDKHRQVLGDGTVRLLDLFCGAGGAAMGYSRAGFDEIVGIDNKHQPRYPFRFIQDDAFMYLQAHGHEFDVIHASPPCQRFSQAVKKAHRGNHINWISAVRWVLDAKGWCYVIENVPTAKHEMVGALTLCGSSFGLPIRRHRLFESSEPLDIPVCRHQDFPAIYPPAWNRVNPLRVISISGGYQGGSITLEDKRAAMGVDWDMNLRELSEAIPPAYTEHIGRQILDIKVTGRCQSNS